MLRACCAAEPAAADPVESVRNLNRIFSVMDSLTDILQEVLQGWQAPRIVILGNQSEGAAAPNPFERVAQARRCWQMNAC